MAAIVVFYLLTVVRIVVDGRAMTDCTHIERAFLPALTTSKDIVIEARAMPASLFRLLQAAIPPWTAQDWMGKESSDLSR